MRCTPGSCLGIQTKAPWNGSRLLQSYNKDETTYLILLDEDIACASPWSISEKMLGSEASSRNSISSLRGGEPTRGNWVAWPALHSQKERGRDTSSTSRARPPCPWGEVPPASHQGLGLDHMGDVRRAPRPVRHTEASADGRCSPCYQASEKI